MATSKELLRAIENGARIETNQGHPVEYAPRQKGDRKPWRYQEGSSFYRYTAANCVAVAPAEAEEKEENVIEKIDMEGINHSMKRVTTAVQELGQKITPEVIEALRYLRNTPHHGTADMVNVLDNAGIFSLIDEATGYDVDPAPERVSKCTCGHSRVSFPAALGEDMHAAGCPGDPAEWGDMAYAPVGSPEWERRMNTPAGAYATSPRPTGFERNQMAARVSKCTCPAAMAHHFPHCPSYKEN